MKILHSYCLNYNLGDYALGMGVKDILRHYLPVDLIAETNLQGTIFNDYFIKEVVNRKYDLLVIGGGGIIHGPHWPNGWFWLIDEADIAKIEIPFIVYGAGYNYFKGEGRIPIHGVEHLKETIRRARHFSVRNDGSLERLKEQTGIMLPETPDPGFHISMESHYQRPISDDYVILQLANDKPIHRFGNEKANNTFITAMRNIVAKISKKYRVILTPHVFDDIELSHAVANGMENCEVWNFSYYAFDHPREAVSWYKFARFVLAMRGHGQILPIGFNVPTISLENHAKNRGLMEKLGLAEYNVDILDPELEDRCTLLIDRIERERGNLLSYYKTLNQRLFEETSYTFKQIRNSLTGI